MSGETMIPMLPCTSLDATLGFYQLLGFDVTYRQKAPNPYAVVRREDAELHFFGMPGLAPDRAFSSCLVIVSDVSQLHECFAGALRGSYGKVPVTGFPRISRFRKGQQRFNVVDPDGNTVRFVQRNERYERETEAATSKLGLALATVAKLRDAKGDDAAAAKVLDVALAKHPDAPAVDRARALVARAELAQALGETGRAHTALAELRTLSLEPEQREQLRDVLAEADELMRAPD